jgi:hypothetical protein
LLVDGWRLLVVGCRLSVVGCFLRNLRSATAFCSPL